MRDCVEWIEGSLKAAGKAFWITGTVDTFNHVAPMRIIRNYPARLTPVEGVENCDAPNSGDTITVGVFNRGNQEFFALRSSNSRNKIPFGHVSGLSAV